MSTNLLSFFIDRIPLKEGNPLQLPPAGNSNIDIKMFLFIFTFIANRSLVSESLALTTKQFYAKVTMTIITVK